MKHTLIISFVLFCSVAFAQRKNITADGITLPVAQRPVPITVVVSVVADTVRINNADKIRFVSIDGQTFLILPQSAKAKPPALAQKWTKAGKQILYRKK